VERRAVALEDHPVAFGVPDREVGANRDRRVLPRLQADLGSGTHREVDGEDLSEALRAVVVLEHHVAPEPVPEAVERGLEGEAPPVDRRRQREHGRLDLAPHRAEACEPAVERPHPGASIRHVR
jgi:hypothetical protein